MSKQTEIFKEALEALRLYTKGSENTMNVDQLKTFNTYQKSLKAITNLESALSDDGCNQPPLEGEVKEKLMNLIKVTFMAGRTALARDIETNDTRENYVEYISSKEFKDKLSAIIQSPKPVESSNMKTEKLDFIDLIKKLKAVEISHDQSEQGTFEAGYEAAKMDTSKIYTQLQSQPVEGNVRSASIDIGEKSLLIYGTAYMPSKREASRTIIDALLYKYNFTRKG